MNNEEVIAATIKYINKEYYRGTVFCQGQGIHKLVAEVQSVLNKESDEVVIESMSVSEDVAPAESETGHYTSGGVDEEKDTEGFSGFANGAT